MRRKRRDYRTLLVGGFLLLSLGGEVYAQDCVPGSTTTERQETTGTLNALRHDFLSIVSERKGNVFYMLSFILDADTVIEGSDIDKLERGDRIRVAYRQVTECREGKPRLKARTATKIKLITQEVDLSVKPYEVIQ